MALKDLVADRNKITEDMIEDIISDYVRYDPSTYEIVLTPQGVNLNNDAKVLVVLVALMGWKYVVEDVPKIDTKPAALEALTGIPGGTLRPVLKKLKDSHLLGVSEGSYSVRIANLDAVARAVKGEKPVGPQKPRARKTKNSTQKTLSESSSLEAENNAGGAFGNKARRKTGVPIRASLARLLDAGFFADWRTLGQVVARLHEMAIIAKPTSLSGPMAELVRDGKLERKKIMEGAKEVWSYKAV